MVGAANRRRVTALVIGVCSLAVAILIGSPIPAANAEAETALRLNPTPASVPIQDRQIRIVEPYAYLAIVEPPQDIDPGIWVPPPGRSRTPLPAPTPAPEVRPPGLSPYLHPIPPVIPIPLAGSYPISLPSP